MEKIERPFEQRLLWANFTTQFFYNLSSVIKARKVRAEVTDQCVERFSWFGVRFNKETHHRQLGADWVELKCAANCLVARAQVQITSTFGDQKDRP